MVAVALWHLPLLLVTGDAARRRAGENLEGFAAPLQAIASEATMTSSDGFWTRRGGNLMTNNDIAWTSPSNLTRQPTWSWPNLLNEQVRHSPLIDSESNIYIATGTRIYKLTKYGLPLWTWHSPGWEDGKTEMVACPSLYGGSIFAIVSGLKPDPATGYNASAPVVAFDPNVVVYSISLATGTENWRHEYDFPMNPDAAATLAHNNTLVFAAADMKNKAEPPANRKIMAVDTDNGNLKWEYTMDDIVWNFSPSTPGDGTLLFASSCGTVYKLDFEGKLLWTEGEPPSNKMCGAGGGSLGPNGVFYTQWASDKGAHLAAYKAGDGSRLWHKTLPGPSGAQYPAVGRLGPDGPLAVVAAIGDSLLPPDGYPKPGVSWGKYTLPLSNNIVAMEAETGKELWRSAEPPWPHEYAAGDDLASVQQREGRRGGSVCWPDSQGMPLISGDGTVYASSGHSGVLRTLRQTNRNGVIEAVETSSFSPGVAFLNSPSAGPGMLVAAPAWGPAYVFLDE